MDILPTCMPAACGVHERAPGPLELELQMAVRYPVGAWELNLVLLQEQEVLSTKKCSQL